MRKLIFTTIAAFGFLSGAHAANQMEIPGTELFKFCRKYDKNVYCDKMLPLSLIDDAIKRLDQNYDLYLNRLSDDRPAQARLELAARLDLEAQNPMNSPESTKLLKGLSTTLKRQAEIERSRMPERRKTNEFALGDKYYRRDLVMMREAVAENHNQNFGMYAQWAYEKALSLNEELNKVEIQEHAYFKYLQRNIKGMDTCVPWSLRFNNIQSFLFVAARQVGNQRVPLTIECKVPLFKWGKTKYDPTKHKIKLEYKVWKNHPMYEGPMTDFAPYDEINAAVGFQLL